MWRLKRFACGWIWYYYDCVCDFHYNRKDSIIFGFKIGSYVKGTNSYKYQEKKLEKLNVKCKKLLRKTYYWWNKYKSY